MTRITATTTAAALRDEIKASGLHCTIPRGKSRPRIVTLWGAIDFESGDEWDRYNALLQRLQRVNRSLSGRTTEARDAIIDELRAMVERTKAR